MLRNFNSYRIKHKIISLVKDNEDLLNESVESDDYGVVYELDKVKDGNGENPMGIIGLHRKNCRPLVLL